MKPVNEKSLVHFLFDQMDRLDRDEISVVKAQAQAKLANEATKLFKMEMDRARLVMDLQVHAKESGKIVELRELAAKGFDDTTK